MSLTKNMACTRVSTICASGVCLFGVAHATETITYSYDALGRLTQAQIAGGASGGVQRTYQFDAAGNRTSVQVSGAPINAEVVISPIGTVAVATPAGVGIGVNIEGDALPAGTITFTENGVFLGVASVADGQASVFLTGLALGSHTITATYSGDGTHEPKVYTFTVQVRDLSWLPAVLDLILSS